jgi:hypothetical protein
VLADIGLVILNQAKNLFSAAVQTSSGENNVSNATPIARNP